MKKLLSVILSSMLLFGSVTHADDDEESTDPSTQKSMATAESNNTMNFTFAPVSLLLGLINPGVDFKVSDSLTVGGTLTYWNLTLGSWAWNASGATVNATWQSNGALKHGLYVSPEIGFLSYDFKYSFLTSSASAKGSLTTLGTSVGYGWFWRTFNLRVGGSIASALGTTSVTVTDSNNQTQTSNIPVSAGLDFRLGFAF